MLGAGDGLLSGGLGDKERMLTTRRDLVRKNRLPVRREIELSGDNDVFVVFGRVSSRTGVAVPPRVDFILFCDNQSVVIATSDVRNQNWLSPWEHDNFRERFESPTSNSFLIGHASIDSKLTLVASTKGIQVATEIQCHRMKRTSLDLDNDLVFECFDL
jgi:hypothetical protein